MKALGIILAGGSSARMKVLTRKRALAAMPVACSYRAIDFVLSSMTNSQIKTVAVLSQYNTRSLNEHLSSSKWWNFGRKQGGLYLFTPTVTPANNWWYRGTADSMYQNIEFLHNHHEPYVVIAGGDIIFKADFNDMLDYHIAKGADITIACAKLPEGSSPESFGVVKIDDNGVISSFDEKPMVARTNIVSAGIYVMRRRRLIELLEQSNEEERFNFVTDILARHMSEHNTYGFMLDGYWNSINTVDSYYKVNMDMLNTDMRRYFLSDSHDVYSKALDLPPTKYNEGAKVINSLVGSGSIINSYVEGSVIFKNVFVGKDSSVKNSIVLQGAYIGDNVHIENCIVEANETLLSGTSHVGSPGIKIISEGVS